MYARSGFFAGPTRLLLGAAVGAALACGDGGSGEAGDGETKGESDGESGGTDLRFTADIQPIFTDNCHGVDGDCHVDGGVFTTPLLAEDDAYSQIVGELATAPLLEKFTMSYVEPFEPENSFLLHKIKGTHTDLFMDPANAGERMPCDEVDTVEMTCKDNMVQLTDAQIQTIEDWIAGGAPE